MKTVAQQLRLKYKKNIVYKLPDAKEHSNVKFNL